jgi:hypothetical protein
MSAPPSVIHPLRSRWWHRALLLSGLAVCTSASADLKTVQLHHRTADDVLPLISPLIEKEGGKVTGSGFQMLIEGDKVVISRIDALLQRFDTPPKRLLITLRQNGGESATQSDGTARVLRTQRRDRDETDQQLRVEEGHWAAVDMTLRVPVVEQFVDVTGGRGQVLNTINYKDLSTGFSVRALVNGDQVLVDIASRKAVQDPNLGGAFKTQTAQTTVSGKLGTWLEIGGDVTAAAGNTHSPLSTADRRAMVQQHILVKVETL